MAWSQAARDAAAQARQSAAKPNALKSVFSSRNGVGVHGPGMYATTNAGSTLKLNPASTGGRLPGVGEEVDPAQHTMVSPGDSHLVNDQGHEWGSPAALADFKEKYGGPRDHAAEQRSFNSGRREINRLRSQGK